jgi:hypothetical protein
MAHLVQVIRSSGVGSYKYLCGFMIPTPYMPRREIGQRRCGERETAGHSMEPQAIKVVKRFLKSYKILPKSRPWMHEVLNDTIQVHRFRGSA